jgi:hypothetical protein
MSSNAAIEQEVSKSLIKGHVEHQESLSTQIDQQYKTLSERLDTLGKLVIDGGNKLANDAHGGARSSSDDRRPAASDIETLSIRMSHRGPCRTWCPCACHTRQKINVAMPRFMQGFLGKMFVGYAGLPLINKACDFRGCIDRQAASATVEYWFPWWLVSMNFKMFLQYLPPAGPHLQLSMTRRVPDASPSITFAMQGNIQGLQHLFAQGLASPRDVSDSRGFSLVRVSQLNLLSEYWPDRGPYSGRSMGVCTSSRLFSS